MNLWSNKVHKHSLPSKRIPNIYNMFLCKKHDSLQVILLICFCFPDISCRCCCPGDMTWPYSSMVHTCVYCIGSKWIHIRKYWTIVFKIQMLYTPKLQHGTWKWMISKRHPFPGIHFQVPSGIRSLFPFRFLGHISVLPRPVKIYHGSNHAT